MDSKQGKVEEKGGERELQKTTWLSSANAKDSTTFGSLNDELDSGEGFDQFEGRKTDYDFNKYSTMIGEVSDDLARKAARIEREIEGQTSDNRHLAEERN